MKKTISIIIIFLFTACGPNSLEDFREEGRNVIRELIADLDKIQTFQQFNAVELKIKGDFDKLVEIIIKSYEFHVKHPELNALELTQFDHQLSEQLRLHIERISQIDGCRQHLEKCQEQALNRLDLLEKQIERKKNDLTQNKLSITS